MPRLNCKLDPYLSQSLLACLGSSAGGVGHVDGAASQWVVVEQQHGLLCCLRVAEGDEPIALQMQLAGVRREVRTAPCQSVPWYVAGCHALDIAATCTQRRITKPERNKHTDPTSQLSKFPQNTCCQHSPCCVLRRVCPPWSPHQPGRTAHAAAHGSHSPSDQTHAGSAGQGSSNWSRPS